MVFRWEYLDTHKKRDVWTAYRPEHQVQIEDAFCKGSSSVVLTLRSKREDRRYEIDLVALRQRNLETSTKRAVRRLGGGGTTTEAQFAEKVLRGEQPAAARQPRERTACIKRRNKAKDLLSGVCSAIKRDNYTSTAELVQRNPTLAVTELEIEQETPCKGGGCWWSFGAIRRFHDAAESTFLGVQLTTGTLADVAEANGKGEAARALREARQLQQTRSSISQCCDLASNGILIPLHRFALTIVGECH